MMVYVQSFEAFAAAAERIFHDAPTRTRYCLKYRHVEGKLVLKVTDDRVCVKFRTGQLQDLKKVERFNNMFFRLMSTRHAEGR